MIRDTVKARQVGESLVITLTKPLAEEAGVTKGDILLLEALNDGRILVRKETIPMNPTQSLELELSILEKRRQALQKERDYILWQYNNNTPSHHAGIEYPELMEGTMQCNAWEISKLDVKIAEKRLEIFMADGTIPGT